ncbi:hypothetical protein [Rhodococcus gannanensis]|uniref:HEAT repeat domain-containing protein n=1 Tax=Rhodococcus gannanensis TaxID=1960308 RepID=A0ABW4PC38_9NOCA
MTVTPALADAIEIFSDLGWRGAAIEDAPTLSLGTAEQRRAALAGLRSGAWGEFGRIRENTYGYISWVDVDEAALALFAIRLGVDAQRSAQIMPHSNRIPDDLAADVLATRGPEFAARFVGAVCVSSRRAWEHCTSAHAGVAVRLVARHTLPVPENIEYLKDWAVYALGALTGRGELFPDSRGWMDAAAIESGYAAHARVAVAVGMPATGPFPETLLPAIERGWIDRDEVVELAFAALDAAQRPGDRKAWLQLLLGGLAVGDDVLQDRADALISVLAFGDPFVVEALTPVLVADADDDLLVDLLTVALGVKTRKARRLVLKAVAARPKPGADAVDALTPLVAEHAADGDRTLVRAAEAVLAAWDVTVDAAEAEADPVRGLWRATPPLWEVPRFELGNVGPAALTDAAAALLSRGSSAVDVEVEHFLALANAVAHDDPDAARAALRGVPENWIEGLCVVPSWRDGGDNPLRDRDSDSDSLWVSATVWEPLRAREAAVVARLGAAPNLLSTPSWVDLRIDPADLLERVREYTATGAAAAEADLYLAMTRLDLASMTDTRRAEFASLAVPVVLQSGEPMTVTVGGAIAAYAVDPVVEPPVVVDARWKSWRPALTLPDALADFPPRLDDESYRTPGLAVFPTWGDAAGSDVTHDESAERGAVLRQAARRAVPFTPGLAVNMLGAQRGFHHAAAADGGAAVVEAWQRGLLRPGVADVRLLDWSAAPPRNLAAFARSAVDLAEEGLLSVLWPVLDALVGAGLEAPRMPAGTADVAEAIARLLPEARAAVDAGAADAAVLDLPGTRGLAARPGSSRAAQVARAIVAQLPEPTAAAPLPPAPATGPEFAQVWADGAGTAPATPDGVTLTAAWADPAAPTKRIVLDLTLPGRVDRFRVDKGWYYDLECEGQCAATRYTRDSPSERGPRDSWLYWDADAGALAVAEHRNRTAGTDAPLDRNGPVPPLTTSMVAVVLAGLCHDAPDLYYVTAILTARAVGSESVRAAMRALLTQPDVSPARMMKVLESDPELLPVLWPVLTESVRCAAETSGPLPRWLNRVLDVAMRSAPVLREAALRGLIPEDAAAWTGLAAVAGRTGSAAAVVKARTLLGELGLPAVSA